MIAPVALLMSRLSPLSTPAVSVWSKPKGLPMAKQRWPTRSEEESPRGRGEREEGGAEIYAAGGGGGGGGSMEGVEAEKGGGGGVERWDEGGTDR